MTEPERTECLGGAVAAAAGVGLMAGLVGAAVAALLNQARSTVKVIEQAAVDAAIEDGLVPPTGLPGDLRVEDLPVPDADGVYLPDGSRAPGTPTPDGFASSLPLVLVMLGDSTSVGYGARHAAEVPGAMLATGLAAALNRPVRLRTVGLSGCGASDLPRQVARTLSEAADIAVILIGANDIRDKVPPIRSADHLGQAVGTLRAQLVPVVVGTCPDFGVIEPIPQPLRAVLHSWSRLLATLQERAVLAAGGRSVSIGRLVSPQFAHHPELFAGDRFHPSGAGYARAVAALLPAAIDEAQRPARTADAVVA